MEALVEEALAFAEEHPEPIPMPEKPAEEEAKEGGDTADSESNNDALSHDEDVEFNLEEDFRQCGV